MTEQNRSAQIGYSDSLCDILTALDASVFISTYESGGVVSIWPKGDGKCGVGNARIRKPLGMSATGNTLSVAAKNEIWHFDGIKNVTLGDSQEKFDTVFMPCFAHYTNDLMAHDIAWGGGKLWVVNTLFSCLAHPDQKYSFNPVWKPPFISGLDGIDKCHLNGLALHNGKPEFVTALGETDKKMGWRENKANGGCIIHIESGDTIKRGLSMPHSPRMYKGELYFINSGNGTFCRLEPETGHLTEIVSLPGYGRGLSFVGDYAFIGLSQARQSSVFGELPITNSDKTLRSGVVVLDMRSGTKAGAIHFRDGLPEVFEVLAAPVGKARLLGPTMADDGMGRYYVTPEGVLYAKPKETGSSTA